MYLVVISKSDAASVNIQQRLFELEHDNGCWDRSEELLYDGHPVYTFGDLALMVSIKEYHLYADNIGKNVEGELAKQGLDVDINTVIFATKHRSESGMRTLTVHPVGNYKKAADYGGRSEELVPTAPQLMTAAYRRLYMNGIAKFGPEPKYAITFEVTHHGPYMDTPAFFIEIGSNEAEWRDEEAGLVLAKTINDILPSNVVNVLKDDPVLIGLGGGHYAPRFSDVARTKCVAFGHMIPTYALDGIDNKMLLRAIERTPGAENVYFHRNSMKKAWYRDFKSYYEEHGFQVVRSSDLEDLQ
jgi:D-aminoacyl-tRNA deacylase